MFTLPNILPPVGRGTAAIAPNAASYAPVRKNNFKNLFSYIWTVGYMALSTFVATEHSAAR
jgi:hypothetical protein